MTQPTLPRPLSHPGEALRRAAAALRAALAPRRRRRWPELGELSPHLLDDLGLPCDAALRHRPLYL